MNTFETNAREFLAQKRIAVAGASTGGQATGNAIYKALRKAGYDVVGLHPTADTLEGDTFYPSLSAVPAPVDGVFIVTSPDVTEQIVDDCIAAGVPRVWMHENGFLGESGSSVSDAAAARARESGITVIDGGCPLMFMDFGHKCMRWILGKMGRLPA